MNWRDVPTLSTDGRDAMERFATAALLGQQHHDCGHTNNSLICPCTATLPPRDDPRSTR